MYIVGISFSTSYSRKDLDSIVIRQKSSLSKAYNKAKVRGSLHSAILQYRKTLRQSIVDLHSLGYPVLSFYVDNHLSHRISSHNHMSLVDTVYKLLYISKNFAQSCLIYGTNIENTYLCGIVHLHKLYNKHMVQAIRHVYVIHVPHMFYIQLQFLEIVLVGGLTQTECMLYQNFKVKFGTHFPFSRKVHNRDIAFVLCGTHPPFTTIVPGNVAVLMGFYNIQNRHASCKVKYSAADVLVSE